MKSKKGISLIVLIITIIVVVILATAVILSIANNNPIENAKKAAFLSDLATMQDELFIYLHKKEVENLGEYDKDSLSADQYSLIENDEEQPGKNIKTIITSMSDKYLGKIEIINGNLQYTDTSNMQEYNWAKESFEGVSSNLEKAENTNSTIEISNATEGKLESLKIYGNSVENVSTGNKVKNLFNLFNMMDAVNGTTILDNGDGTLTVTKYAQNTQKKLSELAPNLKVGDVVFLTIKTDGAELIYLGDSYGRVWYGKSSRTITQEMLDSRVYLYNQGVDRT